MLTTIKLKRGNEANINKYTAQPGEIVIDETNWSLRLHDGVIVGGHKLAAETALKDSAGNVISTTYATKTTVDGLNTQVQDILQRLQRIENNYATKQNPTVVGSITITE